MSNDLHVAIFGMGLSGKTTLAKYLSKKNYDLHGVRSLVLDPINSDWGKHSLVFPGDKQEVFWKQVWSTRNHLVFVDEGYETIAKDRELIPAFTRIRHHGHKLVVIGHLATETLLPIMRGQISTLYMSRQPKKACEVWAQQFTDDRIYEAMKLKQYQFLCAELWNNVRIVEPDEYFTTDEQ